MRANLLFLLGFFSTGALIAQTSTSSISGTVTDPTGAVVPSAKIMATNESTGSVYHQKTTESGLYSFPAVPVGDYTIAVEVTGFKSFRTRGNTLQVSTPMVVDIALEVGDTSDTVEVTGSLEQVQTSNATLGNVVERKAIADLPLNGRNPLNLLTLEPGVVQRSQGSTGSGVHVNGSRDRSFNTTIDGIEANESTVPNPVTNLYRLNPDNVQEFKVTTSNATAEEGRNSGASVSVATRSGTNEMHGTLFEFFRNTALNANQFFANAQNTPKPEIKLNQYGFEAGGPIRRNKTFFFGSWQGQKVNFAQPIDQTFGSLPLVYTAEALTGNFRYFRVDPNVPFFIDGQRVLRNDDILVNAQTGALRPEVRLCGSESDLNCVASYNIFGNDPRRTGGDPEILRLLGSYPRPNSFASGDALNTAAYVWNSPTRVRGPNIMGRVDHSFDQNNMAFARYLFSDTDTLGGDPNNGRPVVFPGFAPLGEVYRRSQNLAVSWRRVVSPRVVNELTVGFSRFNFLFTQGEANPDFPDIPPYDFANVSEAFLNRPRTARAVTTPQILDNLSVVSGSHVYRLGFNFRFYQHNDQRGQPGGVNLTPVLSFSRIIRPPTGFALPTVATGTRGGIEPVDNNRLLSAINELLGIPARLTQVFLGDLRNDNFLPFHSGDSLTLWSQGQRMKQYNFYFQDEWKLRRNVTLNYGVRWEINPAPTEAGGRVYVPDGPIVNNPDLVSFVPAQRWYQRNNIGALGPRIGLTWSPGSSAKTVLRAGYGIAFDPISSFQVTAVAGRVPGISTTCLANPGAASTAGCATVPDLRISEGFPLELPAPVTKPSSFLTQPRQVLNEAPSLTVFDQQLKMPTVHQFNFNIQRELPMRFIAQAGYVGRRGTRLLRAYDINQISADPILDDFRNMQTNLAKNCRPDGTGCPTGLTGTPIGLVTSGVVSAAFVNSSQSMTDLQQNGAGNMAGRIEQTTLAAGLRPNQQFGVITYIDAGGDSYYHSMQMTLRKRFDAGLQVAASYTLAKSIDNQSLDPVGSSSGGGLSFFNARTPVDVRDWRNERGLSDFDRRHVLNGVWLYELPFGRGKRLLGNSGTVVNHIAGGWSLNGIYTFMTGEPFTVMSGVRTSNFSHTSRAALTGDAPEARLQQVQGVIGPSLFKDASGFTIPAPGENGIGRNTFRGSDFRNLDLGLQKVIPLSERVRMQIRAEVFNVLNQVNFDTPTDATDGSNHIIFNRFGETCCAAVAPSSTQNIIQTGESARVIQFAVKLQF